MPKFTVYASETVFYSKTFEAKSKEDARNQIMLGNIQMENEDIHDSEGFQVDDVVRE